MDDALKSALDEIGRFADSHGFVEISARARLLGERYAAREWFLLLLGETSSGKTTWLNTLLGESLLPTSADATTAIPVELRIFDDRQPRYVLMRSDGERETVSKDRLRSACRGSEGIWRSQVWWPRERAMTGPDADLGGLVVLDTPGYNSCQQEHTEVLTHALPEADVVLWVLNFRRGFTPQDRAFGKLVTRGITPEELHERLLVAVNWVPEHGGDRQLQKMRQAVEATFGVALPLVPLGRRARASSVEIWSAHLWSSIVERAHDPARRRLVRDHVFDLTRALVDQLAEEADLRIRVAHASADELKRLEQTIADLGGLLDQAAEEILTARTEMTQLAERLCSEVRDDLWQEADAQIDTAGRFTEAGECSAWVRDHLVPLQVGRAGDEIQASLEHRTEQLADKLEDLVVGAYELELPRVRVSGPQYEKLRDVAVGRAAKNLTEYAFMAYLRGLGGAAGPKAGFVNLAKRVVSKAGRLVGKRFKRAVYDNMGRTLRRIGISAGMAGAALAAIITEAAAYLYGVVRWKAHLRGVLQRALDLPAVDEPLEDKLLRRLPLIGNKARLPFVVLKAEATESIREALQQTQLIVDENIGRRREVLQQALAARGEAAAPDIANAESLAEGVVALRHRLDRLEEEIDGEG